MAIFHHIRPQQIYFGQEMDEVTKISILGEKCNVKNQTKISH